MKQLLLLAMLIASAVSAQTSDDPVALTIEVENHVLYRSTVFDLAQIGRQAGPTTGAPAPFVDGINIGDIVAINGTPVKGIWSSSFTHTTPYRSAPAAGQFIADFDSGATFFCTWQIYAADGTFIGMIRDSGAVQGHAVTGALASFFGAIGVHRMGAPAMPARVASIAEDPANRRNFGGGKFSTTFYLYPKVRPAVQVTANGPAVFHSDLSLVTSVNPARPGETLIVAALGLGPVKPNLEPPGVTTYSSSPLQEVNAPVSVLFNGRELPALNKVGWPDTKTLYRVDFQVPSDAAPGTASVQLTAAWIPGPPVTIPIRSR